MPMGKYSFPKGHQQDGAPSKQVSGRNKDESPNLTKIPTYKADIITTEKARGVKGTVMEATKGFIAPVTSKAPTRPGFDKTKRYALHVR